MFHGAANRETREYPVFAGYRSSVRPHAHQLVISDPSLALDKKLTLGWFAGSSGTPLQRLLTPFLASLIEKLQIEKVIFAGGSGGGFAALYYSWLVPGSVAVVASPQTNIYEYRRSHREAYIQACWPKVKDVDIEFSGPCFDLREIYRKSMDNTVVYLQSNRDLSHMEKHLSPFLSSLPRSALRRLVLKCTFWGKVGHSGSVPPSEVTAWIRAALSAEEVTSEGINRVYHHANLAAKQSSPQRGAMSELPTVPAAPTDLDLVDRQLTARLAAHMLS